MRIIFLIAIFLCSMICSAEVHRLAAKAEKYFQGGKYDSALIFFRQITLDFPDQSEGYFNQGLCYYYTGRYAGAITLFDTSLQLDTIPDVLWMKVLALAKSGRIAEAENLLMQLDKNAPKYYTISKQISRQKQVAFVSKNWYYMIALLFITILLMTLVGKSLAYRGR